MELPVGNKWGEQYKRAQTVYKYAPEKGDWYDHGKYDIEPEMTDSEDDEIVDMSKGGKVNRRLRKNIKTKSRKTRRKYYKKKSKKRKRKKTKKRKHRS